MTEPAILTNVGWMVTRANSLDPGTREDHFVVFGGGGTEKLGRTEDAGTKSRAWPHGVANNASSASQVYFPSQ